MAHETDKDADFKRASQLNDEVNATLKKLQLVKYTIPKAKFDEIIAEVERKIEEIDRLASKHL